MSGVRPFTQRGQLTPNFELNSKIQRSVWNFKGWEGWGLKRIHFFWRLSLGAPRGTQQRRKANARLAANGSVAAAMGDTVTRKIGAAYTRLALNAKTGNQT
jgi:hypothetical protein